MQICTEGWTRSKTSITTFMTPLARLNDSLLIPSSRTKVPSCFRRSWSSRTMEFALRSAVMLMCPKLMAALPVMRQATSLCHRTYAALISLSQSAVTRRFLHFISLIKILLTSAAVPPNRRWTLPSMSMRHSAPMVQSTQLCTSRSNQLWYLALRYRP